MFLGARPAVQEPAAAAIVGAPYDGSSSFRRGARYAPAAIRWASQSIESYSPALGRGLDEVAVVDLGDVDVGGLAPEAMIAAVAEGVGRATERAALTVMFGGDHAVTVGAVTAFAASHPGLRVLILDAHLDLRDEYEGSRWSHATVARRVGEITGPQRVALLGARSGTREEYADGGALLAVQPRLLLLPSLWAALEDVPVYLSIDIDVVDPSAAPGVGNPEPAGPTAAHLLDLLRVLSPLSVVGLDVVEVSPPHDPSGRTAVLAAHLAQEAILIWGR